MRDKDQPDLPFPPRCDPAYNIPGPRYPLLYGSAATEINLDQMMWRRTDGLPEAEYHYQNRWRPIVDETDEFCLCGKRVLFHGKIGTTFEDDDRTLSVLLDGDKHPWGDVRARDLTVVYDPAYPNAFEAVIAKHLKQQGRA